MDRSQEKLGRNDPCSCGSGKKFKHCCARKADQRAKFQDSVFKGVFLLLGPLVAILGITIAVASFRRGPAEDGSYDRVWNSAHGHWHAILGDGSEVEVEPGMGWVPEHGHFHRAQAPSDTLRRHVTSQLDQRIEDAEVETVE
jgi:hypothetical protein